MSYLYSRYIPDLLIPALHTHLSTEYYSLICLFSFSSGLSLYFNLARHAFGDVQKILFPKYFSLNSLLSAITLIQFGKMHVAANVWDVHTYLQVNTIYKYNNILVLKTRRHIRIIYIGIMVYHSVYLFNTNVVNGVYRYTVVTSKLFVINHKVLTLHLLLIPPISCS